MSKKITLPFGTVTLYSNYMVAVINEGITVDFDHNAILEDLAQTHFKSNKFVYITHRINSYSVDPNVYFKTSQIPNLMGFAVVLGDKIRLDNLEIEKMFLSKPLKSFNSLKKALDWADALCAENK